MFEEKKAHIVASDGCIFLELWRDKDNPNVFFTHSHWQSQADLNKYRDSDLFSEVWPMTKQWFQSKAEAWSVERV
jgi:quinol monooxygenase YgiN